MLLRRLVIVFALSLVLAPSALAKGGNYVVDGGTRFEQSQVKAALDASSFDFGIVPGPVKIHIAKDAVTQSAPGQISFNAALLDSGSFAWGVVQHEYGHQVDFALLDDTARAKIQAALGGSAWCSGAPHGQLACERFADLISWAYWQSPDNCLRPAGASDEGGQVSPAAFRTLLAQLLPRTAVTLAAKVAVKPPLNR